MPVVLVAALLPVLGYCVVRALTPARSRGDAHHRDLDVWHLVLGLAMLAGLAGLSRPAALGVLAVSALGFGWGVRSAERAGSYARLAVGAAAMMVMTLPLTLPVAANASPTRHPPAMPGMGPGHPGPWLALLVGATLVVLAVAGAGAARVVVRRPASVVRRLDACCDVVMAGVMAAMLVTLL